MSHYTFGLVDDFEKKMNLLLVDDEEEVLKAMKAALKDEYNVFSATDSKEAMAFLKKHPIQIVICDNRLPGESGVTLLSSIYLQYPETVRLMISGYSDGEAVIEGINKANVFKFIDKPWESGALLDILDEASRFFVDSQKNKLKDQITGLYSPYALFEQLEREIERSYRNNLALSFLLLEVTELSKINEIFGVSTGNRVMAQFGQIFLNTVRKSDIPGRLDENKILILLTDTIEERVYELSERMMKKIHGVDFQIQGDHKLSQIKHAVFSVTGSSAISGEEVISALLGLRS